MKQSPFVTSQPHPPSPFISIWAVVKIKATQTTPSPRLGCAFQGVESWAPFRGPGSALESASCNDFPNPPEDCSSRLRLFRE
eukprot:s2185_g6.t1